MPANFHLSPSLESLFLESSFPGKIGKCYLMLRNARSCLRAAITCPEYFLNGTKLESMSEDKDI